MSVDLRTLAYASRAAGPISGATLSELLLKAQRFNKSVDVTGLLVFADDTFVQTLEGPTDAIDRVYERIVTDSRHASIRKFLDTSIQTRVYPEWAMMSNIETASPALTSFLKSRVERSDASLSKLQTATLSKMIEFISLGGRVNWLASRQH